MVTREERLESQDFRQHPHLRRSDDTAGRFGGSVSFHGPDGILDGGIRGGRAVLRPTSSIVEPNRVFLQMSTWCMINNLFLQWENREIQQ